MKARGVLVVDDDAEIRETLSDLLADEGYAAREAENGLAALELLRTEPLPEVILLDWTMEAMNGQEFMAEVAKDPALAAIPVVLVTADVHVQEKVDSAPFVGHLTKPIRLPALFQLLEQYTSPPR
ncbi:MAG TPA: response regulator [Myxococcales bacterium]|nr:response regulator [Myxococcales bacterium]